MLGVGSERLVTPDLCVKLSGWKLLLGPSWLVLNLLRLLSV